MTPLNWFTAFGLNYVKFGGMKGWKARVTRNVLPYFQSFGKMKGCVIVDDRTDTGYVGNSTNPAEYPRTMPNFTPHSGLLNGVKISKQKKITTANKGLLKAWHKC